MDTKKLQQSVSSLIEFCEKKNSIIENDIISDFIASGLSKEIDFTIQDCFENLFGEMSDLKNKGILNDFDYSTSCFEYGIMLSYFNFLNHEEPNHIYNPYRNNPYYKGVRWSIDINKKNFYFFFDKLKEHFDNDKNTPVSFIVNSFCGKKKYIKIKSEKFESFSDSILDENDDLELTFPIFSEESDSNLPNFKSYISMINEFKSLLDNRKFNVDNIRKEEIDNYSNAIKNKSLSVLKEFEENINNKKSKLVDYTKKLNKVLNNLSSKKYEVNDTYKMILLYQFYDIPYVMHFFLPDSSQIETEINSDEYYNYYCSLAFSTNSEFDFNKETILEFKKLISTIEGISALKEKMWENVKVKLVNEWKKIYDANLKKYELLASSANNIINAICIREKIDAHITYRVKTFDSLYNKLLSRANGKDSDFPNKNFDSDFDLNFNCQEESKKNERLKFYKKLISLPDQNNNASLVLKNIKDIIGIRLICKFENDVKKFHDLFLDENDEKIFNDRNKKYGLQEVYFKDYTIKKGDQKNDRGYYYTSHHYIFNLSPERKDLIEFSEIYNISFELQVRTTLSQGISDVSHDIFYKTNLPEKLNQKLKEYVKEDEIKKHSWTLNAIDEAFSEIENQFKIFKTKFIRYL